MCHIVSNVVQNTVCNLLCGGGTDSQLLPLIVTSATAGLMVTRASTSPGRAVRSKKKFSVSSGIVSLVISTNKHCRCCVFENGPTSWVIAVKSLLPRS